jgi:uncharacterized membrane protein (DUF106 family)
MYRQYTVPVLLVAVTITLVSKLINDLMIDYLVTNISLNDWLIVVL